MSNLLNRRDYQYDSKFRKIVYHQHLTTISASHFDYESIEKAIEYLQDLKEQYSGFQTETLSRWGTIKTFIDGTKSKVVEYLEIRLQFQTEDTYGAISNHYEVTGIRDLDPSEQAAYGAEVARAYDAEKAVNEKRDLETFEALKKKLGK